MTTPDFSGLASALRAVLGERLEGAVVYGSAVTGDFIPGFSDVDLAVFAHGALRLDDTRALQEQADALAALAGGRLQLGHWVDVDRDAPRPLFVPGAFMALCGPDLQPGWMHSEESLRAAGQAWLAELPGLVRRDAADWAVASGAARRRMVRLLATRLKPAIRAALTEQGHPVLSVWASPWNALAEFWSTRDGMGARALRDVLGRLPPNPGEEQEVGDTLLAMLWAGLA